MDSTLRSSIPTQAPAALDMFDLSDRARQEGAMRMRSLEPHFHLEDKQRGEPHRRGAIESIAHSLKAEPSRDELPMGNEGSTSPRLRTGRLHPNGIRTLPILGYRVRNR